MDCDVNFSAWGDSPSFMTDCFVFGFISWREKEYYRSSTVEGSILDFWDPLLDAGLVIFLTVYTVYHDKQGACGRMGIGQGRRDGFCLS